MYLDTIIKALLDEFPDVNVTDGRFYARGRDVTEPITILLGAIHAEPDRADELAEQAVERVVF